MKSPTIYIVLGAAVVLVSLGAFSMFGAKQLVPTTPVATSTVATSTTASTTTNGMQVYRNEQFGFQFEWAKNEILSDKLDVMFFSDTLDSPPRFSLVVTSDTVALQNEIQDNTFPDLWKPTWEVSSMSYGTVTKKTWITNPHVSNSRSCMWYVEAPKAQYLASMSCKYISSLDQISKMFDTPLSSKDPSDKYQIYSNKKMGIKFSWDKSIPLSQKEILSVNVKIDEYQNYELLSIDSDLQNSINEQQKFLNDPLIKVTKKVFEKPYGAVTEIKGEYNVPSNPFCAWSIKNPYKDYVMSVKCSNVKFLDSLTFF